MTVRGDLAQAVGQDRGGRQYACSAEPHKDTALQGCAGDHRPVPELRYACFCGVGYMYAR